MQPLLFPWDEFLEGELLETHLEGFSVLLSGST